MNIANFNFETSNDVMIVAELSANHNQDINIAIETIKAAKKCGADAIKLQTYTPDTITIDCDKPLFRIEQGTVWDGTNLYDLYKKAYTPWEWHDELFNAAHEEGLICFSSPFDPSAVDFLEKFNPPAYKIASFEITDIPLISYIASKKRPLIISTGIAGEEDIQLALKTCYDQNNRDIILLKCTSSYPAPVDEMNLNTIPDMARRFNHHVGLSDHSLGIAMPAAAVALGARVIEKHLILRKSIGGPDAGFSLEPEQFSQMVETVRTVEKALGKVNYQLSPSSIKNRKFSRSLFAVKDIAKGEVLTSGNIRSIRPGDGLHPKYYYEILGKPAKLDIKFGTPLSWDLLK
jgi:pseudaminic acid synthase